MAATEEKHRIVQVRASNPGHLGRWRAGRFFPNDAWTTLMVFGHEEDPTGPDGKPYPDKVGAQSYNAIVADPNLTVKEAPSVAAEAAIEKAGSLERALEDATKENARLRAEVAKLTKALEDAGVSAKAGSRGGRRK